MTPLIRQHSCPNSLQLTFPYHTLCISPHTSHTFSISFNGRSPLLVYGGFIVSQLIYLFFISDLTPHLPLFAIRPWPPLINYASNLDTLVHRCYVNELALNVSKYHSMCYSLKSSSNLFPTPLAVTRYHTWNPSTFGDKIDTVFIGVRNCAFRMYGFILCISS